MNNNVPPPRARSPIGKLLEEQSGAFNQNKEKKTESVGVGQRRSESIVSPSFLPKNIPMMGRVLTLGEVPKDSVGGDVSEESYNSDSSGEEIDFVWWRHKSDLSEEDLRTENKRRVDGFFSEYRKVLKVLDLDKDEKLYDYVLKRAYAQDFEIDKDLFCDALQKGMRECLNKREGEVLEIAKHVYPEVQDGKDWKRYLEWFEENNGLLNQYVKEKLEAQCEVWGLMLSKQILKGKRVRWFPMFKGVEFKDVWKLLLDERVHEKGCYAFEQEMGYIRGMMRAFAFILTSIQKKRLMNFAWFHELRKVLVTGVYYNMFEYTQPAKQEMRLRGNSKVYVDFKTENIPHLRKVLTSRGLKEGEVFKIRGIRNHKEFKRKIFVPHKDEVLKEWCEAAFKRYYVEIKKAESKVLKERVCVDLAIRLVGQHIYSDANMRMAMLVLYRVLIENGLDLFILREWIIVNKSEEGLKEAIEEGKGVFKRLKKKKMD